MRVEIDDLSGDDVRALLAGHLAEMRATTPACSVHALDLDGLSAPHVTVWAARDGVELLGAGALSELDATHGELKSMRTAAHARGRGVAAAVLGTIMAAARARGYRRLSLETGSYEFFAPARRLYARHGFVECGPFAGYRDDPNSVFMTLALD
ncbi:GNAT family N-acetyltransferase [Actinotalea sp. M2MS4P-6]|uniref:GNAT family N-acetyltransferase n=1 Tax=Actinotalea sp. M2MS4P-6 TaxID=2983762 RepID=UPI0021E42B84|nr:GNAT family N-acetyltransferase [Actinotalea sp. M2MS4P-6]MCV2393937.1 GNAT family N-acetyltransferase [Actinotalea sp. M2MS4P-6]